MNRLFYRLLRGSVGLISRLPFPLLYALSDVVYVVVYHLIGYRRRVVRQNLRTSFPDKSERELRDIERHFYHFFCDYLNETFKLLTISKEELRKHLEFRNIEQVETYLNQGRDCAAMLGHYGNWEWLSATSIAFQPSTQAVTGLIYHPLYNKAFNQLFIDIRESQGGTCIPKKLILRYLAEFRRKQQHSLMGYISDQGPKWENIHLWIPFLNHETAVFTGGERIMRKMNNAVFYVDMERPCRGKYVFTFKLITDQPQAMEEHAITKRFFAMLEESVRREPRYYLWTHNRWKRTHEEFDRRFIVENGHVLPRES